MWQTPVASIRTSDLARARLVDRELGELEPPELADDDAAIHVASSSRDAVRADERERQVGLGRELLQHRAHALLAADGEAVRVRAGRAAPRPRRARAP